MSFSLPTFNLSVEIFAQPSTGVFVSRGVTLGNLTPGKRIINNLQPADLFAGRASVSFLLLPPLTNIQDGRNPHPVDWVEVPLGSGAFYAVIAVWDVAKGFTNEYREAAIIPAGAFPEPYP